MQQKKSIKSTIYALENKIFMQQNIVCLAAKLQMIPYFETIYLFVPFLKILFGSMCK